jgi:hypothetical protein
MTAAAVRVGEELARARARAGAGVTADLSPRAGVTADLSSTFS